MIYLKLVLVISTLYLLQSEHLDDSPKSNFRYLALGDSYTIGESVLSANNYPQLLKNKFIEAGLAVSETKIIAKTGWRTDDLMYAINREKLTGHYDVVTLLIGVNNQYQHKPIDQYKKEFRQLLETAIKLAGGHANQVFVISIPDYGYTPFGLKNQTTISAEIDSYNAINKKIAKEYNVKRFDITPISRQGIKQPELVAKDGLHPSERMYQAWIEFFGNKIIAELKSPKNKIIHN